jgi:hypothetical protein
MRRGTGGRPRILADALVGRSSILLTMGRLAEGAEDGRRSLAMARDLGYLDGEGMALEVLRIAAWYSGDNDGAVQLFRQQQSIAACPAGSC